MSGTILRGKLTRADLAQWDGRTATYSRADATGGTVTGLAVGNEVDVLQVFGAGSNRTVGTIADAIQLLGSTNVTLVFAPGTWTIDSSITIPSNFTCHIPRGCLFSVDSGKTLTFSGPIYSEWTSFYTGSGTTTLSVDAIVGGKLWIARTLAEISASLTPSDYSASILPIIDVRRYGLVPNDTSARTANSNKLKALVDPTVTGPVGRLYFPNVGGNDTYYFNQIIQLRPGCYWDLDFSTLDFSKSYASGDNLMGFLTFIRDVQIENGAINVDYDGSAGTNAGSIMRIGSREGYPYSTYTGGLNDEDLSTPMGNIRLRNLALTSNNATHMILALGGIEGLTTDQVSFDGQSAATAAIYYEFGDYHYSATASLRKSSHAKNWRLLSTKIKNVDSSTGSGIELVGAIAPVIQGLDVNTAGNALIVRSGEALFYNMGTPYQVGKKIPVKIDSVTVKNIATAGMNLTGAESKSGGYLSGEAGVTESKQVDLLSFDVSNFDISAAGYGILCSGPLLLRNGTSRGASGSGGLVLTDECIQFDVDNVNILDGGNVGVRGNFTGIFGTPRLKIGSIRNSFIAGNTGPGINLGNCQSVLVENCRLGYSTIYDGVSESTQTVGVNVTSDGNGVVCVNNYVSTSGGANAYVQAGTGTRGCQIYNPSGTITVSGNWGRDGMEVDNATNIADKTSVINTVGKYTYKRVYDTSNARIMVSQGTADVSAWKVADASATVTPA